MHTFHETTISVDELSHAHLLCNMMVEPSLPRRNEKLKTDLTFFMVSLLIYLCLSIHLVDIISNPWPGEAVGGLLRVFKIQQWFSLFFCCFFFNFFCFLDTWSNPEMTDVCNRRISLFAKNDMKGPRFPVWRIYVTPGFLVHYSAACTYYL